MQQAGFVANLGVAFMDDWVFLADRVMGNENWLCISLNNFLLSMRLSV